MTFPNLSELPSGQRRAIEALICDDMDRTYAQAAKIARMAEGTLGGDYAAVIAASRQHSEWGDLIGMLRDLEVPCLVYAGDADARAHGSAEESVKDIRYASFVSLPGLDHLQGISRIDLVLPHVMKFLQAVSRET